MLWPRTLFGLLFDCRAVSAGWIRVMGVLAATFGVYYLGTAFGDHRCELVKHGCHVLRARERITQSVTRLAFEHISRILHRRMSLMLGLFHSLQGRRLTSTAIPCSFEW